MTTPNAPDPAELDPATVAAFDTSLAEWLRAEQDAAEQTAKILSFPLGSPDDEP